MGKELQLWLVLGFFLAVLFYSVAVMILHPV